MTAEQRRLRCLATWIRDAKLLGSIPTTTERYASGGENESAVPTVTPSNPDARSPEK
jgi:hypothetical protein